MTADIELLPSSVAAFTEALKGERGSLDAWLEVNDEREVAAHVEAYARANVAHATTPLQAEIEALRAELREAWAAVDSKAGWEWRKRAEQAEARAERLAEALRHQSWCRTCGEDGWDSCEEGRAAIDLLRDYDQEAGNGWPDRIPARRSRKRQPTG